MDNWSEEEHEIAGDYSETLQGLVENSRPHIMNLTQLARDYGKKFGHVIVEMIKLRIFKCQDEHKLPALYLVDSIIKNHGNPYNALFSRDRVVNKMFVHVFSRVKEKTREALFKLRGTWTPLFPNELLYALDMDVKRIGKFNSKWE